MMANYVSRINSAGIICLKDKNNNSTWKQPKPALYTNIFMLWRILELIFQDWERAVEPFQNNIDNSPTESEKISQIGRAFLELPTYYFKCLFSYVTFFISLENAYELFYEELNKINKKQIFRIKHHKKPLRNNYIKKVRNVRNISIAHIGSKEVPRIDAKAGMAWEPLLLRKTKDKLWNISEFSFGSGKWKSRDLTGNIIEEQSIDLEIGSISELHIECMNYINSYDEVCTIYLNALGEKLPAEDSDTIYSFIK